MTLPTLLLFDLDETVAPDEETNGELIAALGAELDAAYGVRAGRLRAALEHVAEERWGGYETASYCARIGISSWEGLWGPFGPNEDAMLAALHQLAPRYRMETWREALAACGLNEEALADELAARFLAERRRRQAAYPWSRGALEGLRGRFRLGMITNGAPDLQRLKLAGTGLTEWFEPLVVSGDLGSGKPEPAIFAHALERAGVAAEAAVMIGDSWPRDVLGATAAGLRAVWVNARGIATPPLEGASRISAIRDLRGLPEALARL